MAKPAAMQKLDKGKLLTGKNFPQFVDTWNYATQRIENLKGDRDANPQNGHITIDNADPEHPIIRYVGKNQQSELSGGVTSIIGEDDSTAISGDVQAQGAEGSGLVVRTENREDGDDQSAVMEIDIADREEDEEYAGREMIFDDEVIAKFFGTDDFDIAQRYIVAGDGIIVDENMDTITISRTHDSGGGEISAGAGITVNDKTVSVNPDGISIQTRNGSTVADKKVQLAGFDNISSSRLDSSIGNDLLAQQESGDLAVVASLIGSGYAIRYKPMGTLGLVAEEGSGIKLTKESENNANQMKIDLKGRDDESFSVHNVYIGGRDTGVKAFSSSDVVTLDVAAGNGVKITREGPVAFISLDREEPTTDAITDVVSDSEEITCVKDGSTVTITFNGEGEETKGYTGTETVVTSVTYDTGTHQLKRFYKTFTFSNGLLTEVSDEQSQIIDTAVEETV